MSHRLLPLIALAGLGFSVGLADAKPARCFATDEGYFPCDFQMTDRDGSFEIYGDGFSYSLVMDRPGFAFGFVNLGPRNIPITGMFVRERSDPACWSNPETTTKVCAW